MASFGIDPALLVVDEAEVARLKASGPLADGRQAANLERELSNMHGSLHAAEGQLIEAARAVVELLGNLKAVEAAHKRLEKVGEILRKDNPKDRRPYSDTKSERQREARITGIVASWKANIARFLDDGPKSGPTNEELISLSREREKTLEAAGL